MFDYFIPVLYKITGFELIGKIKLKILLAVLLVSRFYRKTINLSIHLEKKALQRQL